MYGLKLGFIFYFLKLFKLKIFLISATHFFSENVLTEFYKLKF